MYQSVLTYLAKWNENTDERVKLQHVYAFGGVALLVVAGLVGLVNYTLGQTLMNIALISIAVFFINAIVWALVTAFLLLRLEQSQPKSRSRKH